MFSVGACVSGSFLLHIRKVRSAPRNLCRSNGRSQSWQPTDASGPPSFPTPPFSKITGPQKWSRPAHALATLLHRAGPLFHARRHIHPRSPRTGAEPAALAHRLHQSHIVSNAASMTTHPRRRHAEARRRKRRTLSWVISPRSRSAGVFPVSFRAVSSALACSKTLTIASSTIRFFTTARWRVTAPSLLRRMVASARHRRPAKSLRWNRDLH